MTTVNALMIDLIRADGLARDLARSDTLSDVERVHSVTHVVHVAVDLASLLDRDRDGTARELAGRLPRATKVVRAFERELRVDWHRGVRDNDRVRARYLARVLASGGARAAELVREVETSRGPTDGVRLSVVSCRLTRWSTRVLPVVYRPEYAELFRSELYDLVLTGSGRSAQISHALRVLVRAPLLRRELRALARERSW